MNLKAIMANKKISQYRLAKLSGVSQSHISRLERDMRQPSIVIAQKLAAALGVTITELIGDNQQPTLPRTG